MAKCMVYSVANVQEADIDVSLEITYNALFYGADIPNESMQQTVPVVVLETDTLTVKRSKVTSAMISRAAQLGGVLTAGRTELPVFQKGA